MNPLEDALRCRGESACPGAAHFFTNSGHLASQGPEYNEGAGLGDLLAREKDHYFLNIESFINSGNVCGVG